MNIKRCRIRKFNSICKEQLQGLVTYVSDTFNIKITCVEPGGISTEFMMFAIEKTGKEGQFETDEYLPVFENLHNFYSVNFS